MVWTSESINLIDDIYNNIEKFQNSRGHVVEIPTLLFKVLLKATEPKVGCLEEDVTVEVDEDEIVEMIKKAHKIVHH